MEKLFIDLYRRMDGEAVGCHPCLDCNAECCNFEYSGHLPFLTLPEWSLILNHIEGELPAPRIGFCPFLDEERRRCAIYPVRPFRCRLYFCHRFPGANSLFSPYSAIFNSHLQEYRRLTEGLEDRSILDFLSGA